MMPTSSPTLGEILTYQQPYPSTLPAPSAEPPLWAPYYGASLSVAANRFFKKYATFSGRASRSEYWWWVLISVVVGVVMNILVALGTTHDRYGNTVPGPMAVLGLGILVVWSLATFIPGLALSVRRMHDAGMSGWMILLALVPFVGAIAILVFMVMPASPEGQRFDRPEPVPAYRGY